MATGKVQEKGQREQGHRAAQLAAGLPGAQGHSCRAAAINSHGAGTGINKYLHL